MSFFGKTLLVYTCWFLNPQYVLILPAIIFTMSLFKTLKRKLNTLTVIVQRKKDSSKKTFYYLQQKASQDSAEFMYPLLSKALLFTNISDYRNYCLTSTNRKGYYFEFGVFRGESINYFANMPGFENTTFYGFDSFEGLSEAWGGTKMGKQFFDQAGSLPKVQPNVRLIKGWIDDTLPEFITKNLSTSNAVDFIHVDVDTYTPTSVILKETVNYFVPGTILMFDELLGYPGWREHEHKALEEIVAPIWHFEYIAFCEVQRNDYTSEYIRAAIKITARK